MSNETERTNTTGCVAKRGSLICHDPAAPGTAGLLCPTHLNDLRAEEDVKFRSGLAKYQRAQISMIKNGTDPLGSEAKAAVAKAAAEKAAAKKGAPQRPKDTGEKKVEKLLLSFPAIFALTGTSTLLLFEQVWTTALGISLPFGAGLTSGISPLLPQLLVYLLAMAVVFIVLMMSAVLIALAVGALVSTGFVVFSGWPLYYLALLYASRVFDSNSYMWLRWAHNTDRAQGTAKNKDDVERNWSRLKGWPSRQVAFVTSVLKVAIGLGSWAWNALFGAETVTARVAAVRAIAILFAFGILSVLTSLQGLELRKQINAQEECRTLHADLGDALVRLPPLSWLADDPESASTVPEALRVVQQEVEDFIDGFPFVGQFLTDAPEANADASPSAFQVMTTFLRVEVPCGRVTMASAEALEHSPLHDATLREDTQLSGEAFYLGRYGDWVVFAPLDGTEKRVLLTARQVLGFSRVDEEDLPRREPFEENGPTALKPQATYTAALAAVRSDLAMLRAQVDALRRIDTNAMTAHAVARVAADRPWLEDVRRAAQDQAGLTRFVTAAAQQLRTAGSIASADAALETMEQMMTNTLEAISERPVVVSMAVPDAVVSDLTAIRDHFLNPSTTLIDTPVATIPGPTRLARQKAELLGTSPGHGCDAPLRIDPPVIFDEGQTSPTAAVIIPIVEAIRREQATAGTGGRLLVLIEGFASGSGSSARNEMIAEARADNVKSALVERMFTLVPPRNGDQDGPALLAAAGLIVVAEGQGETLDGVGRAHPRRADVALCWLERPSVSE